MKLNAKPNPFKRVNTPTQNQIFAACGVLRDIHTAIYQALYAEGYTQPAYHSVARPFHVAFTTNGIGPSTFTKIHVPDHPDFDFMVDTPDEALTKTKLVFEAINAGKIAKPHHLACCPLAVQRNCVCDASFECPIHGSKCHGTHD